ncbi:hypothetical protein SAY87_001407 [Trapa incisa]|uniref:Uncharacterized protein n=1 Tax=Trapa incisa TaxID=236973 RepID=A0AAN7JAE6_9MYRT|nr:hypothetical protein SAY87_001407 [Trapa incisa]
MMVLFSCFNAQIYHHKPKKIDHSSSESMDILGASFKIQANEAHSSTEPSPSAVSREIEGNGNNCRITGSTLQWDWKGARLHQTGHLKKSQSEIGLHLKGRISADEDTEDESHETDKVYSCDHSNDHSRSALLDESNEAGLSPTNYGMPNLVDTGQESSITKNLISSCDHSPQSPHLILRSRSLPNLRALLHHSVEHIRIEVKPRSSDDLYVLNREMSESYVQEVRLRFVQERERHYGTSGIFNDGFDNPVEYDDDPFNYDSSVREWIVPIDGHEKSIEYGSPSVSCHWDDLPGKDFKIKRIEDWVINLQPCFPIEETDEMSQADKKKNEVLAPHGSIASKVIPGTEAAKSYISSLNPGATSAQLSNHSLVVIPFLSAFVSLKVLNLSGNSIARITAGSLQLKVCEN